MPPIWNDGVTLFRTAWQDVFVDTIIVRRLVTLGTLDPATSQYSGGSDSTVYTGPAVVVHIGQPDDTPVGDGTRLVGPYIVRTPWDVADFAPGDKVTVTIATHDPTLQGKTLNVQGIVRRSFLARRDVYASIDEGQRDR